MHIQLMTIAQLAEEIASKLNYSRIWQSELSVYDFAPFFGQQKDYRDEELSLLYLSAENWCSFRKLITGVGSTTLYAMSDLYGGGSDHICRLYDGIGKIEAEILIQETLIYPIQHEISNGKDSLLIVETHQENTDREKATPAEHIELATKTQSSRFQEGICPVCGGELKYSSCREDDDNGCSYPWTCKSCGATGKESYSLLFDGNHYDVQDEDGNDIDLDEAAGPPLTEDMIWEHYKTIHLPISDSFAIDIPFDLAWQVANAVDECYACIDILSQIPEDKRNKVTYEQLADVADDYKDYRAKGMTWESAAEKVIWEDLFPDNDTIRW